MCLHYYSTYMYVCTCYMYYYRAVVVEVREYGEHAHEIASFWLVNVKSSNSKQIANWLSTLASE